MRTRSKNVGGRGVALACVIWIAALPGCEDGTTGASQAADSSGSDTDLGDGSPSDAAPSDGAPSDGAPSDAVLSDSAPSDATPSDATPSDAAPSDAAGADLGAPDSGGVEVPAGGRWQASTPLPVPRQETAVLAFEGEVWVLGGFTETGRVVPDVWIFDPESRLWRAGPPLPVAMHHANAAVAEGRVWVLGFLTGLNFAADGRGYVFDPEVGAWAEAPSLPPDLVRGAAGVAVLGPSIYLVGGLSGGQAVAAFTRFDTVGGTFETLPAAPRVVDHLAVAGMGGRVVVAGGRAGRIGAHTPQVDVFTPESGIWSQGAPVPTSRGGAAAAAIGDRLYVFGGEGAPNESGVFAEVEVYDLVADAWQILAPMPTPRHGLGAAALDGRIYLPGGAPVQAFGASADHEVFEPPR